MKAQAILTGYKTLVRRETTRIFRIWIQTLLPGPLTTILYFIIFGSVIGGRIGTMQGLPYIVFITPGLIMMMVINSAYSNSVFSLFSTIFQRNIEELLASPMPDWIIILGYTTGSVIRGIVVGMIVAVISMCFTHYKIHSYSMTLLVCLLTSILFALAGLCNALVSKSFDALNIVPSFVLTPLSYLGGVFYSVDMLHGIWFYISMFDPITYVIDAFRGAYLGQSSIALTYPMLCMLAFIVFFFCLALTLLRRRPRLYAN